jgi:agmatine deiminase
MSKNYGIILISLLILSSGLYSQEKKPDWRKLHYLSEEEMHKSFDNTRDFYETDPPAFPVRNVAEFEQMQAVLVRYPFGIPITLVKEMARDLNVITIVANATQEQTVLSQYLANGVNTENCSFIYAASDSYWTRDYGPWYIFDGNNQPGIVNFPYNRPRPNDNDIPIRMAEYLDVDLYGMNISHTGGNYMTDGLGKSASTDLVLEENTGLSEEEVDSLMNAYLGIENYFVLADPLDEYIKHIDCWGKFLSPGKVLIGQVPESDYRYDDYEATADYFQNTYSSYGKPYQVFRVYTPGTSPDTPYTNSLILNNKVFVPLTGGPWDDEAIAAYEEAMPGYEVIGITYGSWENTDALHCRAKGVADLGMLYIRHMPILGLVAHHYDYEISADIIAYSGADIYSDSVLVYYRVNDGDYLMNHLEYQSGTTWTGMINDIEPGDHVMYYLYAADESGRRAMHPYIGQPDPHEFNAFTVPADELSLEPDTLLFLTFEDCINGLPLDIINVSNDSVEITNITQEGFEGGFYWIVEDMPELPVKIASNDTLTLNVMIGIPVSQPDEMLQDTIFVETENREFSSLIIVNSDLVEGQAEFENKLQCAVYPNPFRSELQFEIQLVKNTEVKIDLFDLTGRKVYFNHNQYVKGQTHLSLNAEKIGLRPGTYVYQLKVGEQMQTGKVIYKP